MPIKLMKLGIRCERGWKYYVSSMGQVLRTKLASQLAVGEVNTPLLVHTGLNTNLEDLFLKSSFKDGFIIGSGIRPHYYLDADGDISSCPGDEKPPYISSTMGAGTRITKQSQKHTATIPVIEKEKPVTNQRIFEYKIGTSNKYWNITWTDNFTSYTATWGKAGTLGTSKTKKKSSKNEIDKKIAEKLAKGYQEKKAPVLTKVIVDNKEVELFIPPPSPLDIL